MLRETTIPIAQTTTLAQGQNLTKKSDNTLMMLSLRGKGNSIYTDISYFFFLLQIRIRKLKKCCGQIEQFLKVGEQRNCCKIEQSTHS